MGAGAGAGGVQSQHIISGMGLGADAAMPAAICIPFSAQHWQRESSIGAWHTDPPAKRMNSLSGGQTPTCMDPLHEVHVLWVLSLLDYWQRAQQAKLNYRGQGLGC